MDSIANFIIKMKNAGAVRKSSIVIPYTKLSYSIAEVLEKNGFIKSFEKKGKKVPRSIGVELAYENNQSKIKGVERISKQSRRVYLKSKEIRPVRQGYGLALISTPRGILTDREARKSGVGGEILFKIW